MKTAILIDGGFFLKKYKSIKGFSTSDSPETIAENMVRYCFRHIRRINNYQERYNLPNTELYRIFYYDATPFDGDAQKPVSNKQFSFKNTPQYKKRNTLFIELKKKRKIALRLGFLKNSSKLWTIKAKHTKSLLKGIKKYQHLQMTILITH